MLLALISEEKRLRGEWAAWRTGTVWTLFGLNIFLAMLFYAMHVLPGVSEWPRPFKNWYFLIQWYFHLRSLIFAVAQGYLQLNPKFLAGAGRTKWARIRRCFILFVYLAVASFIAYQMFFMRIFNFSLGSQSVFYALEGSELYRCLQGVGDEEHCAHSYPLERFTRERTELGSSYTYEDTWYGASGGVAADIMSFGFGSDSTNLKREYGYGEHLRAANYTMGVV